MAGDIEDRIRARAHEIWEREGHPQGREDEHWKQAEAEIQAEEAHGGPSEYATPAETAATPPAAAGSEVDPESLMEEPPAAEAGASPRRAGKATRTRRNEATQ